MRTNKIIFLALLLAGWVGSAKGQNIAINTTGATANASAMLDITSTTSGLLIPRMTSVQRNAIGAPAQGLIVYDLTLNAFYYYNAGWWPLLSNSNSTSGGWSLTGNAGTTAGTNFIGTTDVIDWVIKTSNTERMRVLSSGNVGIGTTTAPARLTVLGDGTGTAYIGGNFCGGNYTGISLNGQIGGCGVYNILSSPTDPNFYLNRPLGYNMYFRENNSDQMCITTGGNVGINTTGPSYKLHVVGTVPNSYITASVNSDASGTGLTGQNSAGAGGGTGAGIVALSYQNGGGFGNATVMSFNNNATGTAVAGGGNNVGFSSLVAGSGGAFTGSAIGLFSMNTNAGNGNGALYALNNGQGFGVFLAYRQGGLNYKIISTGGGSVSCSVPDLNGNYVVMHAPETPEIYFEDYGFSTLINGKAHVEIDPVFAKNVAINDKHPLRVFIQLEDNEQCKGVVVKNKSGTGFDVIELGGGTSNTPFQWHIVCNVGDTKSPSGEVSKYSDARFEEAPKMLQVKENYTLPVNK